MDLDTRHLRALVTVVDEGTFTDAAIALGVSQASVSRSVQRLETVVGAHLLSRSSRHVEPTPTGTEVLVHARRVLATLEQIEAVTSGAPRTLVMGYAWSALGAQTVPLQRAWAHRGHGELVLVQTNTASAGLLEGRCEVAVVRREVPDPRLTAARVGRERRYAALPADHPLAARVTVRLPDLVGETVAVDVGSGTTTRELWPPGAAPRFLPTHGVDDWLTLIASGRALGVSVEATAAQHPRPGVVYRPVEDAPSVPVWLLWRKDDPPPQVTELVELARAAYSAPPAWESA